MTKSHIFLGMLSGNYAVGNKNIFIGVGVGSEMNASGDTYNTAVGHGALDGNFGSGKQNTIFGALSAAAMNNGSNNIAVGYNTANSLTNGNQNIVIGDLAGDILTTGSTNILLGYSVDVPAAGSSNFLNIGNTIYGDMTGANTSGTGTAKIGINDTTPDVALDVVGDIDYTGILTDVSDRRMKTDIAALPDGQLEKLMALHGVSFKMKDDPEARTELGLIAQDVEAVYPALVKKSGSGIKSLNYMGLIGPMIEGMRELKAENDALRARIEVLEAERSQEKD